MKQLLDYEIIRNDAGDEFQVWTPDAFEGAIIGVGHTEEQAMTNAVRGMLRLCDKLVGQIRTTRKSKL